MALNPNGGFTYTPDAGFVGTDTFTYTASDGMNFSAPATVSVAVAPPKGLIGRAFGYHASKVFLFGRAQPDIGPTPSVTLAAGGSTAPERPPPPPAPSPTARPSCSAQARSTWPPRGPWAPR